MSPPIETSPGRRSRIWLLAAALLVCLCYLAAEAFVLSWDLGFPLDDSWIHLQFARNLAAGRGLSYNAGELVTGSTSPLWTAVVSLLFLLPGNAVVWVKLLGIALYVCGVDAAFRLARELDLSRGLSLLAAAFTLATSWLAWSALSGMEVPLCVVLVLWGLILHLRERRAALADRAAPPLAAGVLAIAALARPEALALLALSFLDNLLVFERGAGDGGGGRAPLSWRRPALRPLLVNAALAACVLAGPLLFYRWAGGSFLPTTFAAKGGALRHRLPDLQYVYVVLGIFFRPQPLMTLLAGAGVLALVERLGTPRDRGLLPALWPIAVPLAYSLVSPPGGAVLVGNFGRYYFPFFPLVVVLGVVGFERAAAVGPRLRAGAMELPLGAVLLALLAWPTLTSLVQGAGRYVQNVANVQDSDVRMARWLAPRLPPQATLAVNDLGALKFLLPNNRVIDLAGIANPEIRRALNQGSAAGKPWEATMAEEIARRQPDYLVIFPSWFPRLAQDPRFRPLHAVEIRDNITMGGSAVVLYATPWTRWPLRGE